MNKILSLLNIAILSVLIIGFVNFDAMILRNNNNILPAGIAIPNFALAQEDEDDDEDEDTTDEETTTEGTPNVQAQQLPPTTNTTETSPNSASFTVSRVLEGNASMMQSQLPLIKKIIVGDISDIVALQTNTNSTIIAQAQIVNEIAGLTQSVARVDTIKSILSDELDSAINTVAANAADTENSRILVDNKVQCTPSETDASSIATALGNRCQFTISIHQ